MTIEQSAERANDAAPDLLAAPDASEAAGPLDLPAIFKALADPTRYRIFQLLLERSHCTRSLAVALGISEPAVSQQMAVLKGSGLVVGVRHCRHIHYAVDPGVLERAAAQMSSWANVARAVPECHGFGACPLAAASLCTFRRLSSDPAPADRAEAAGADQANRPTNPAGVDIEFENKWKRGNKMRVAVPSDSDKGLESTRSGHFGHSPFFTIATIEGDQITKVEVFKNVDHDTAGCFGVIEYAQSLGIDAIVVRGMGRPPFMHFTQAGIRVYIDGTAPLVKDVLAKFISGDLMLMGFNQACVH